MSNKHNLLSIILFIFVYLAQSETSTDITTTELTSDIRTTELTSDITITELMSDNTTTELTSDSTITSESTVHSSPTATQSTIISTATVNYTTGESSSIFTSTMITNTDDSSTEESTDYVHSSTTDALSNTYSMASHTSISSTSITSAVTTSLIGGNITEIYITYRYIVRSGFLLLTGNITNSTVLGNVQKLVNSSFNLPGFNISVIKIEIILRKKSFKISNNKNFNSFNNRADSGYLYDMLVEILFATSRTGCYETCINNTQLPYVSPVPIELLDVNGTFVEAHSESGPLSPYETTTTVNLPNGESPPGLAAQLGMGLGISIFGVLLIAEIIFLYRKYGLSDPTRRNDYRVSMSNLR